MGKLALTVVGMGIGFAIGGPFGAQIGAMVGGMVGNILFAPTVKGPRLTDLTVTASTYGQVINELYGTMRMGGNMIWTAGIKEHKHTSGGKGGPKQETYTYTASFAIAFCKGKVDGCTRIWGDGKLIAGSDPKTHTPDQSLEFLLIQDIVKLTGNSKGKYKYHFYLGSEEQEPDATIVAKEGSGKVPGYRGLAYIVFIDMPLEDFGNRIPVITAEITRSPAPAAPYVNLASNTNDGQTAPNNFGSRGDVDWANNRFYKMYADSSGTWFVTYDIRTMQELYRVAVQPVENGLGPFTDPRLKGDPVNYPTFNQAFSIGGNYFFANTSLHNSGTAEIWDATSGAGLGRIGQQSNAFPASPNPDSSQPFFPEGALIGTFDGQAMWFRTLGLTDQTDLVYHAGNLGSTAIVWDTVRFPVHLLDFGAFGNAAAWTPMRGQENAPTETDIGSSDMLFLNNHHNGTDWDLLFKRLTVFDGLTMTQAGGPPFSMSNSLFNTEVDITIPRPFAGEDLRGLNFAYDKSDNSIVIWGDTGANNLGNGGTWRMAKYLIDEGEFKWAKKDTDLDPSLAVGPYTPAQSVGYPTDIATQSNLDGGTVGWMRPTKLSANSALYVVDLQTGELTVSNLASPLPNFQDDGWAMNAWDDLTQSVMGAPTRVFVRAPGDGVTLQSIVDDVLTKTKTLTPGADWDSSQLADIKVHGYVIAREASARDVLQQLAGAYFFDGVESDYIIKCVLRGGNSIATVTQKHLGFVENNDTTIKESRTQEVELPMRVSVTYSDPSRDYQDGTQSMKRLTDPFPTMHSHNEVKIELPIALSATEAKQIADKSLKMSWASRWNYDMKWPWEFIKYDPTDIINVVMDNGTTYVLRLDKIDLGVDYTLEVDGIAEVTTSYVSTLTGDSGSGVPTQTVSIGGPVDFWILNTPLMRDIDDTQGANSAFYVTAKARSPGDFVSAYIFESTDASGTEFQNIESVATEPTWGIAVNALPTHFNYAVDNSTVLTVRVLSRDEDLNPDVLESCTYDELLGGSKNAAIVGNEIIQFMTVTPRADGITFDLTGLLRARRGTNFAATSHAIGERFIMLATDGSVKKDFHDAAEWATPRYYKAISGGDFSENADNTVKMSMEPNDLKPYTPECVKATDDGTNITITFERRSRISNELHDSDGNVPYKEGQGSLAHFVYKVYGNKLLTDTPWADALPIVAFTGNVPVYSGISFAALTFNFAKAGLTKFVVEIYEVGYVDGFSKYVQFVNVPGTTEWDMTELY